MALPTSSAFTGSTITEGDFKAAMTELRDYLAALLGTSGAKADALLALGSAFCSTTFKTGAYTVTAADRGRVIRCANTPWVLRLGAAGAKQRGQVVAQLGHGGLKVALSDG